MSKLIQHNGSIFDSLGLLNDLTSGFAVRPLHGNDLPQASQIKVNIHEKEDAFEVTAELPGVDKKDIDISVDKAVVTISAEINQHDEESKEGKVLRSERYFGSVSRSFQLPADVDSDKSEAKYENGILKLDLPKLQGNTSKKLSVK